LRSAGCGRAVGQELFEDRGLGVVERRGERDEMHEAGVDRDRFGEGGREAGQQLLDPEGRERNRARQRQDLLRRAHLADSSRIIA
jgi:hypothetical protein